MIRHFAVCMCVCAHRDSIQYFGRRCFDGSYSQTSRWCWNCQTHTLIHNVVRRDHISRHYFQDHHINKRDSCAKTRTYQSDLAFQLIYLFQVYFKFFVQALIRSWSSGVLGPERCSPWKLWSFGAARIWDGGGGFWTCKEQVSDKRRLPAWVLVTGEQHTVLYLYSLTNIYGDWLSNCLPTMK